MLCQIPSLSFGDYGIGCSDNLGPELARLCIDGIAASAVAGDGDRLLVLEVPWGA